jgi:nucleotide-binding universal stress UspA family protein
MGFKDILVYLDPTPASMHRVMSATRLAKTHQARLIGVVTGGSVAGDDGRKAFEEAAGSQGLTLAVFGPESSVDALSRCVDLIVASAPNGSAPGPLRPDNIERAVTESGVPVLILPDAWNEGEIGRNAVIAWNSSREAIRAVHDAMPFLKRAAKVTVFAFSSAPSDLRRSAEMLVDHLGVHGVAATVSDWTNTGDMSAIEAMFASLDTQDADLFVAGAFGHSRVWETLFGGVSLDLIRQQSVPLLMSH